MIVDVTPAPNKTWRGDTRVAHGCRLETPLPDQVKGACSGGGNAILLVPLHQAVERRPVNRLNRNTTAAMTSRA